MEKTLIVWHRFGKEHGEDNFQVNSPEVIAQSLKNKVDKFSQTAPSDWCWWKISDDLLVEKNRPGKDPNVLFYHLIKHHVLIIENATHPDLDADWTWYVHIGDTYWHPDLNAYVFQDLFIDVLVHKNNHAHTVVDLDDFAYAIEIGLITPNQSAHILRQTQNLINTIQAKQFPPPELATCREQLAQAGLLSPNESTSCP